MRPLLGEVEGDVGEAHALHVRVQVEGVLPPLRLLVDLTLQRLLRLLVLPGPEGLPDAPIRRVLLVEVVIIDEVLLRLLLRRLSLRVLHHRPQQVMPAVQLHHVLRLLLSY